MPDPPVRPYIADDDAVGSGPRSAARRRRWVRSLKIVAVVLVLLFGIAQVTGGPGHPGGSESAGSGVVGKGHLDEARGHVDALLNLFR